MRVAGNKPLPASVSRDIAERTDGIPLFVDEMTKAVLEAESKAKRDGQPPPFQSLLWRSRVRAAASNSGQRHRLIRGVGVRYFPSRD